MATKYMTLPVAFSNKGKAEKLTTAAGASLLRMTLRMAGAGINVSVWSALRSKAEQTRLFRLAYTPVSRGRRYSTDRAFQGRIWALKDGHLPVASPDYVGGSVGTHRQGRAIDVHPASVQAWIQANGRRFGWTWDTGKRLGEPHHYEYVASLDKYRGEGVPKVEAMQKALGVTVDGKPGAGFGKAVRAFQAEHGLEADGIAGPTTQQAILDGVIADAVDESAAVVEHAPAAEQVKPGWMPNADRSQTWDGNPHKADVSKLVLHTTEGSSWPGYQGGGVAPHFTVKPGPADADHIRQHMPTTEASKALAHPKGTPETNNAGAIQVEIVGSCDRAYAKANRLRCTEDYGDDDLASVAAVVAWISEAHGFPLTVDGLTWPTSDAARTDAPQRFTEKEWGEYAGVCGHTHVPHNDHWDPGAFPVARLLELAGGAPVAAKPFPKVTLPTGKDLLMKLSTLPDFPLLRTNGHLCYYGPADGPQESVSGKSANSLNPGEIFGSGKTSGARGLKAWQKRMGLTADGRFGARTQEAARALQKRCGLTVDGKIGPSTFYAAWLAE